MKSNEPAFPRLNRLLAGAEIYGDQGYCAETYPGMSIRQLYAAMAMQALLANPKITTNEIGNDPGWMAEHALMFADALIAAEEEK